MKKLRLTVFNTQPPLFLGGVERRILETAKHLQNEVDTFVYSGTKAGLREAIRHNAVTVVPCFSTDRAFPLDNWTFNQTLARNANAFQADVCEVHTASGYALLRQFKKKGIRTASVQVIHGTLADEYVQAYLRGGLSPRGKIANLLMWQLAKNEEQSAQDATLVVTISRYSISKIKQYYPNVDSAKIRLVPNGVDTERFQPTGDCQKANLHLNAGKRQIVLSVGRLIPRKGLTYLIEAAKQVVKERKDTLFVLVGNGPLRSSLEATVQAAGLAGNFRFLGDVSEQELPQLYRCCDVFAFPSIQEGQGIVALEAQASAKPVVAFNVSGTVEAVRSGETGLLVKPADADAFAQALLKLLADQGLREKLGAKGREFVRTELSWDITAKKMLAVYREAQQKGKE